MADPPDQRRISCRVTYDSWSSWHEIHARTGATISALVEELGPYILTSVEAGDGYFDEVIELALRQQAERARRGPT